jgi:hypothetical protein
VATKRFTATVLAESLQQRQLQMERPFTGIKPAEFPERLRPAAAERFTVTVLAEYSTHGNQDDISGNRFPNNFNV